MHDLEHSIQIAAEPAAIKPLISTPRGLTRWWARDLVSAEEDELAELGFFDRATVYRLRKSSDSEEEVTWRCESGAEWEGTALEFRLEPSEGGTTVRFAHRGWAEATPYFVSCNTTWGGLMFRLKAAAEGFEPGPLFGRSALAG